MRRLALSSIRFYQLAVSPYHLPCCRFVPSCSQYALEAFTRFGFFRAAALTLTRLLRCHPLGGYGYDPVPDGPPVSGGAVRCGTKCAPSLFTSTDGNTHHHGKQTRHAGRGSLPGGAFGLELPVPDPKDPPEAPGAQPG
ncbi:membrane protein insertion efficiency factor YidD [Desulfolutivibrio sulfoxidireducens]|uniref:membrane protein insertion efficiency factor YidD n=1 Tax=Desulfolutivibrio sulfoxidireducens TaxID=2773299 RepID=UPI00159E14EF|nr:membrane protein insertion efficiency factor YidD [Desulfolutivibrio sulfoxidireducens]